MPSESESSYLPSDNNSSSTRTHGIQWCNGIIPHRSKPPPSPPCSREPLFQIAGTIVLVTIV